MRLTGGGNLGINNATPVHQLAVHDKLGSFVAMQLTSTITGKSSDDGFCVAGQSDRMAFYNKEGGGFAFYSDNIGAGAPSANFLRMVIQPNGTVGIGTAAPGCELHVKAFADNNADFCLENASGHKWDLVSNATNDFALYQPSTNETRLTIKEDGNIGIGINNPNAKLEVKGKLRINPQSTDFWTNSSWKVVEEIPIGSAWRTFEKSSLFDKYLGMGMTTTGWYWITSDGLNNSSDVKYPMSLTLDNCGLPKLNLATSDWCDFVFEPSYKRMSFDDQEQYYKNHKHLKGVPSENEMIENGVDILSTVKALTMNLEEARLDIIELNKLIIKQNNIILNMQKALDFIDNDKK